MNKPENPRLRAVGGVEEPGEQSAAAQSNSTSDRPPSASQPFGASQKQRNQPSPDASTAQNWQPGKQSVRRRGIFLLPNIITTASLFAGFYATIAGMNGRFGAAALAILASVVLDAADGRVARLTRTQSNFGAQYDSLSDMVAFGVAPAFVLFSWGLANLGQLGWVLTFLYIACTALRLARFNTQGNLASFTGLPSPAAAAVLACILWVWTDQAAGAPNWVSASAVGLATAVLALLMVSNFAYFSPKRIGLKGRVPFVFLVLVVLSFAILLWDPPLILLLLFTGYALSAPAQFVWRWAMRRRLAGQRLPQQGKSNL